MYTVIWKPSAADELASLWIDAPDRAALAAAADRLDALLRLNPQAIGESRAGPLRVALLPPLGIDFEVREQDRLVEVLAVWRIK